jgi:putative sterol carrier protein
VSRQRFGRRWSRPRFSRGALEPRGVDPAHPINAFAQRIELAKLDPEQFVRLLETLHMLGTTGAGVELPSLTTETLVGIVGRASKEQIKAIANHRELRSVFLDEIFRRMSEHFLPERAKNVNIVVGWRFSDGYGEDGFDRFQTVIEDGVCVSSADLGRSADTTVTLSADDFIRMATGTVAVATMFVTGRVRVRGEYAPVVRFSSYFEIPEAD